MNPRMDAFRRRIGGFAFGGDYNPEQWDRGVWDEDVRLMRDAGVNLVTLGVFAWASLEPEPGRFTFGWLDAAMGLLHANGISVDLATPTAAPPAWLAHEHPETLPVTDDGHVFGFGSRLHFDPTSPVYRQHAARITARSRNGYRDDIPVLTNFMRFYKRADYWRWACAEDAVALDIYPDPGHDDSHVAAALNFDLMRSLRGEPWILMEQAVSAVSQWKVNNPKRPGRMRLSSYQAIAHGAHSVLFFQWRASRGGHERFHSAMLRTPGRPRAPGGRSRNSAMNCRGSPPRPAPGRGPGSRCSSTGTPGGG